MYEIIKNYRDNEQLRHSFNELAMKTFDIDFEDWYQNGYWTDRYNPHSIVIDGKVVANVSVNTTVFEIDTLVIDMVISDREQDMNRIAQGSGKGIHHVVLGFTPEDTKGIKVVEMDQDDRTLHVKGDIGIIEEFKLMFPLLAHA